MVVGCGVALLFAPSHALTLGAVLIGGGLAIWAIGAACRYLLLSLETTH